MKADAAKGIGDGRPGGYQYNRSVPLALRLSLMFGRPLAQGAWALLLIIQVVLVRKWDILGGMEGEALFVFFMATLAALMRIHEGREVVKKFAHWGVASGQLAKAREDRENLGLIGSFDYQVDGKDYRLEVEGWRPRQEASPWGNQMPGKIGGDLEEQERQAAIAGRLRPELAREQILYDPQDPEEALILRLGYPEIEVGESAVQSSKPINGVAVMIMPTLSAAGVLALWVWILGWGS